MKISVVTRYARPRAWLCYNEVQCCVCAKSMDRARSPVWFSANTQMIRLIRVYTKHRLKGQILYCVPCVSCILSSFELFSPAPGRPCQQLPQSDPNPAAEIGRPRTPAPSPLSPFAFIPSQTLPSKTSPSSSTSFFRFKLTSSQPHTLMFGTLSTTQLGL